MTEYDLTMKFHEQNQDRMKALEKKESDNNDVLIRIEANTNCLPSLIARIDSLESSRDKQTGALWILGLIWAGIEFLAHWFHKN